VNGHDSKRRLTRIKSSSSGHCGLEQNAAGSFAGDRTQAGFQCSSSGCEDDFVAIDHNPEVAALVAAERALKMSNSVVAIDEH